MLIKAYLFVYNFFKKIMAFMRSIKFMITLNKLGVFVNNNPEDVLQVIGTFILSESAFYGDTIKMSRDMSSSTALLLALIDFYLEGHSNTHLEQLLEVLKNEFIQRGME